MYSYLAIWLRQLEKIYKVEFSCNSLYFDSRYKPAQSHIIITYYFWVFKMIKVSGYDLNSHIVCWRQFVVLNPGVNVNRRGTPYALPIKEKALTLQLRK